MNALTPDFIQGQEPYGTSNRRLRTDSHTMAARWHPFQGCQRRDGFKPHGSHHGRQPLGMGRHPRGQDGPRDLES